MKTCPACAEEIQDAAIVCKHCQHHLTTPRPRWVVILLVVGVLIAAFIFTLSSMADSPELTAFKARRAAWHQRCDAYRNTPISNPAAAACNVELNALVAYAKQQGW